ncbi:MAG TPA: glucose 1-dehydrogenase [Planctomycetota bacterium]|nr:glucose 1-dehydrogenase [Planctomycetota bacterium]
MSYLAENFGLAGKRAVVTGAGKGIGRAIAEGLAGAGAEVCLHYNASQKGAEEAAAAINKAGGQALTCGGDLTQSSAANALFEKVRDRWGALDILVNNTGDLVQRSKVIDFTDELLERVVRVNIHSAVYCTRAALPLLKNGREASIVNVSSIAAHHGGSNGATVYAATKAAIHTYTRGLAKELAPQIRVNAIAPGVVNTDFHKTHSTPESLANVVNNTPLKRLGAPEDQAGAVLFLCSKAGSFITGEIIEINGGLWLA